MHDIRWIRENTDDFDAGLSRRGLDAAAATVLDVDARHRGAQTKVQEAKNRRNEASKEIGAAKKRGEDAEALVEEVGELKDLIRHGEEEERRLAAEVEALLSPLPNLPAADVPDGLDEVANIEVRRAGEPPTFDFDVRDHVDIGEGLGMMDFEAAARMSGARFVVLKAGLARLERALANFMLDIQTEEFGYQETKPPSLVRDSAAFGTGQLPKFSDDLFRTDDGYWLIPTAEVPLTNLVREQIITEAELPIRRTAYTSCYRSEAGAAGKDTRGMIRQHEFTKVEMVTIAHPDRSDDELEFMTGCAEEILKRLGLAYRVIVLSCGDMGFSARKTYDIEVWLPAQDTYREISSCSNCGDFQARRMQARFRPKGEAKGTRFVHTLNGSGLAVGRTLIAVLENYQQSDGSVLIPDALRPYMAGREVIRGEG
ncbi:MAG: serine--tRNA ligase [Alphaproteobacteria bacterium]|nr:serine--tRNA ligase [Alphaproteobacteria bacterium]|tara:strand:+ start:2474 stop:3754 length:1281 start_codon:yes stop_codon:yes gene_type:complete